MANKYTVTATVVQHCNTRNDYKLIQHEWDPLNCDECAELGAFLVDISSIEKVNNEAAPHSNNS